MDFCSNLLVSNFVVNDKTYLNSSINLNVVKDLKSWLSYKEKNSFELGIIPNIKTQSITFLHFIEIETFEIIINDLYKSHKNKYPFSNTNDFINDVLCYTINQLEKFIEIEYYIFQLDSPSNQQYLYYTYFDEMLNSYQDFIVSKNHDIKFFSQYYKVVLKYLNKFDLDNSQFESVGEGISSLFNFIDFLHSNIEFYQTKKDLLKEMEALFQHRVTLKPNNNYKDKIEYSKVQKLLEEKQIIIDNEILGPIKKRADELGVYNYEDTASIYNCNSHIIHEFTKNFKPEQVVLVQEYRDKYNEFRKEVNHNFFDTFFLHDFDIQFKELFDYFTEPDEEKFPIHSIKQGLQVQHFSENSILEEKKFEEIELHNVSFNKNPIQQLEKKCQYLEDIELFCSGMDGDIVEFVNGVREAFNKDFLDKCTDYIKTELIYKNPKNEVLFNEIKRVVFDIRNTLKRIEPLISGFNQTTFEIYGREKTIFDFYKQSTFELKRFISLTKNVFKGVSVSVNELPPQQSTKPKPEPNTLSSIITHKEAEALINGIKTRYKNIRGKRLKLLLFSLQELELLPKERIAKKFHDLCKSEFDWDIASYNAMNRYEINTSNTSTDLNEVEGMKQNLKTLLNTK